MQGFVKIGVVLPRHLYKRYIFKRAAGAGGGGVQVPDDGVWDKAGFQGRIGPRVGGQYKVRLFGQAFEQGGEIFPVTNQ